MPGANVLSFKPLGGPVLGVSRKLPLRNGYSIPQLGFGTYRMSPVEAEGSVEYAIACGFRHVDCAKAYSNQSAVGEALYRVISSRRVKREDLFLTSKLWPTDQHPDNVEKACRETLAQLQLDYLDLYLIHWPVAWRHSPQFETEDDKYPKDADGLPAVDNSVKLLDTWKAMCGLVDRGLVHSIGLSNCAERHITEVMSDETLYVPVVNQIELHPGLVQRELLNVHGSHHILTAAYSPLGMPSRFTSPDFKGLLHDASLQPLSEHSGFTVARVLLNWNLDMHNVVIVRSTNKDHIKSNAKASLYALSDPVRMILDSGRGLMASKKGTNKKPDSKDAETAILRWFECGGEPATVQSLTDALGSKFGKTLVQSVLEEYASEEKLQVKDIKKARFYYLIPKETKDYKADANATGLAKVDLIRQIKVQAKVLSQLNSELNALLQKSSSVKRVTIITALLTECGMLKTRLDDILPMTNKRSRENDEDVSLLTRRYNKARKLWMERKRMTERVIDAVLGESCNPKDLADLFGITTDQQANVSFTETAIALP